MSSANKMSLELLGRGIEARLLINMTNSNGPRIEPCDRILEMLCICPLPFAGDDEVHMEEDAVSKNNCIHVLLTLLCYDY